MAQIQEKTRVAGSMLWALLRPVVLILGGLLMLLMLALLTLSGCAKEGAALGVIGGADGPTAIIVTGPSSPK